LLLQLDELRIGTSTTDSLEKDQHHRSPGQLVRHLEPTAAGLRQRKIGGDLRDCHAIGKLCFRGGGGDG
jgi:hypothetical protein